MEKCDRCDREGAFIQLCETCLADHDAVDDYNVDAIKGRLKGVVLNSLKGLIGINNEQVRKVRHLLQTEIEKWETSG